MFKTHRRRVFCRALRYTHSSRPYNSAVRGRRGGSAGIPARPCLRPRPRAGRGLTLEGGARRPGSDARGRSGRHRLWLQLHLQGTRAGLTRRHIHLHGPNTVPTLRLRPLGWAPHPTGGARRDARGQAAGAAAPHAHPLPTRPAAGTRSRGPVRSPERARASSARHERTRVPREQANQLLEATRESQAGPTLGQRYTVRFKSFNKHPFTS